MSKKKKIILTVVIFLCGCLVMFLLMNNNSDIQVEKINKHKYLVTNPDESSVIEHTNPARGE